MPFYFQIDTEQLLAHLVEAEMIKITVSFTLVAFPWFLVSGSVLSDCVAFSERGEIQGKEVQFSLSFLWISGSRVPTVKL